MNLQRILGTKISTPCWRWLAFAAVVGCAWLSFDLAQATDGKLLARFGSWSLLASADEKFVVLSEPTKRLGVACSDSLRIYQVTLQVIDGGSVSWDESRKASYFHFTAWADGSAPQDFMFYVAPREPLMAVVDVSLNPTITTPQQDFWHLLKSARQKVSYSTPAATFSFDATDLQTAINRFEETCGKIVPTP